MEPADETTRAARIRQVVAEYRSALRQQQAPPVVDIVARHTELGDELLRQLLAVKDSEAITQAPASTGEDNTTVWPRHEAGSTPSIQPGAVIGHYQLVRELGRGGMGVVYEAEDRDHGRRVALKVLSPDLPHNEATTSRFLNEASLAAGLSHPRTTFVYEAGQRDEHFFISMELMPGHTLKDLVESSGPMPFRRAVDHLLDVLEGLEAAHASGVVHRDVKPSNCFLDAEGRVKVGDFGLSKSLVVVKDLTQTGTFLGTPQFAAPEQFGRGTVDRRTDIFAAAATLYFLISGEGPFRGDAAAMIAQIVADDPPPLSSVQQGVPKSLSRIVARGLNKDSKQRFQDASEFRAALLPYSTGGTPMGELGRRVAAFSMDVLVNSIVTSVFAGLAALASGDGSSFGYNYAMITGVCLLVYFVVFEGLFSASLGKRLFGLRVVDIYGERPGLLRAFLRACIVPGLSWITVDVAQLFLTSSLFGGIQQNVTTFNSFVAPQLMTISRGLLCLLVCSTMRRSNGLRGLHEFASGTRVVRIRPKADVTELPGVPGLAGVRLADAPEKVGAFRLETRLGESGATEVLEGRDDQLARPVWAYRSAGAMPVSRRRRQVTRHTRQRWLAEVNEPSAPVQVFEAIEGAPIEEAARYATIPWEIGRNIWHQVAEEVEASLDDGTLPEELSTQQVWVNRQGRVKLSDMPVFSPREAVTDGTVEAAASRGDRQHDRDAAEVPDSATLPDETARGMKLLADTASYCTEDDDLPANALDLIDDLRGPTPRLQSPREVLARLKPLVSGDHRLRWDDRLGVLAVSMATEASLLSSFPLVASATLARQGVSPWWGIPVATLLGVMSVAVLGYFCRGGPSFWLSGVELRRRSDGSLASRFRCAWRNSVAWFPLMLFYALIGRTASMIAVNMPMRGNLELVVLSLYQIPLVAVLLAGGMYAVLQPRRGLQDWCAGTYLVRRLTN